MSSFQCIYHHSNTPVTTNTELPVCEYKVLGRDIQWKKTYGRKTYIGGPLLQGTYMNQELYVRTVCMQVYTTHPRSVSHKRACTDTHQHHQTHTPNTPWFMSINTHPHPMHHPLLLLLHQPSSTQLQCVPYALYHPLCSIFHGTCECSFSTVYLLCCACCAGGKPLTCQLWQGGR